MKYPRTRHLPFSPGATKDDRILETYSELFGHHCVVTEKMDGENTSFHQDNMHIRSLDGPMPKYKSRTIVRWSRISHLIPRDIQIVVEDLHYVHSIVYDYLTDFLQVIGVIDKEKNEFLSFDECRDYSNKFQLGLAPVIFESYSLKKSDLLDLADSLDTEKKEGFVVRRAEAFSMNDFSTHIAKWVRKDHVKTDIHWNRGPMISNKAFSGKVVIYDEVELGDYIETLW